MMVRFGFHPCLASSPSARASSSSATWPDTGSSAPFTQPSWWLPRNHPDVRLVGAAHGGDHVVDGLQVPVECELQVNLAARRPMR